MIIQYNIQKGKKLWRDNYVTMNKSFIKFARINFVQKAVCFKCSTKLKQEFYTQIIQIF